MATDFQNIYERATDLFNDSTTATTTLTKSLVNDAYKLAVQAGGLLDNTTNYIPTVANTYIYDVPSGVKKITSFKMVQFQSSGSATATTADKLVDSAASFGSSLVDKVVYNTTDDTTARITAVDSATQLTLDTDIMASGEDYVIGDGNVYVMEEVASEQEWDRLKDNIEVTSDSPTLYYVRDDDVEIYPTPETANNILFLSATTEVTELSADADEPLLAEHLRMHLAYYALSFLYLKREELGLSREFEARWKDGLKEINRYGSNKIEGMAVPLKSMRKVIVDPNRDKLITKS